MVRSLVLIAKTTMVHSEDKSQFPAVAKLLCILQVMLQQVSPHMSLLQSVSHHASHSTVSFPVTSAHLSSDASVSISLSFWVDMCLMQEIAVIPHMSPFLRRGGGGGGTFLSMFINFSVTLMCLSGKCSQRMWPSPMCHHHSWGLLARLQLASPSSYT